MKLMNKIELALEKASDTKAMEIGTGAMKQTGEMFKKLFQGEKAIVIADNRTYAAAGEFVEQNLINSGIPISKSFIFDDPELYAEWSYLEQVEQHIKDSGAIAVAVGSGVINDLCKLASHHLNQKYMVVGTAASMDGYTAYGASITFEGNKQTFDCPAPAGIIFDPEVAAKAPKELVASGYSDLIAKIPAGADWMIAQSVGSEKIDDFAFHLVQDGLRDALKDPDAALKGDVKATEALAKGLIMSGFAMQAILSSRPASGTEHQFSHFWDMEGMCYEGKHVSHGFKVAIGTLVSTACLEYLLDYNIGELDIDACVNKWPSWEQMESDIRTLFADRPAHMERALTESKGKYTDKGGLRRELERIVAAWPVLREEIRKQIMPYKQVEESLKRIGAPYKPEMIGISKAKLKETFRFIPYMRNRYTNIDLIFRCGLMDTVEEHLFGENGIWQVM